MFESVVVGVERLLWMIEMLLMKMEWGEGELLYRLLVLTKLDCFDKVTISNSTSNLKRAIHPHAGADGVRQFFDIVPSYVRPRCHRPKPR